MVEMNKIHWNQSFEIFYHPRGFTVDNSLLIKKRNWCQNRQRVIIKNWEGTVLWSICRNPIYAMVGFFYCISGKCLAKHQFYAFNTLVDYSTGTWLLAFKLNTWLKPSNYIIIALAAIMLQIIEVNWTSLVDNSHDPSIFVLYLV